jgi:osmoprotectant transport system permease protein
MEGEKMRIDKDWRNIFILAVLLFVFVYGWGFAEKFIYEIYPVKYNLLTTFNLVELTWQFIFVAVLASIGSLIFGLLIGFLCLTKIGKDFRPIIVKLSTIGRTFPTMALLALIRPVVGGIGLVPCLVALIGQGSMPIILNTISGIENIPKVYIDVAEGMGMNKRQIMKDIKIPLALPILLSGVRTTLVMCVGGTTLAAGTGAGGLGRILSQGMSTTNTIFLIESTIPILFMSLIIEKLVRKVEDHYYVEI